jgi:hypothetical protein
MLLLFTREGRRTGVPPSFGLRGLSGSWLAVGDIVSAWLAVGEIVNAWLAWLAVACISAMAPVPN